mmetsp:Transcript_27966/g.64776  ORF Transcript_27966/g.64776 Transcript_27966/m.64776 type:complete len:202 (+) Transcript_27966:59-664(+)
MASGLFFLLLSCLLIATQGFVLPDKRAAFLAVTALASSTDAMPEVKVGDKIPNVAMMEGQADYGPPKEVMLGDLIAGKKVAIFAVPGAFTPGCSKSHLPSFIEAQDELKSKGVELTICIATNDAFVMEAWGRTSGGADAGIVFLSDANGELTKALGVVLDKPVMMRTKRFSLIAEDGVVTNYFSSDEEQSNTWAPSVLAAL